MSTTSIEWTTFTVNPIRARLKGSTSTKGGYSSGVGHYCEKISPGCKNCYASTLQPRFGLPQFQEQRTGETEVFFDASKLEEVLRLKKPAKVFWCDMTDMFGSWVPNEWIAACFGVMAATPHLTHQVLTKRADRLPEWFAWMSHGKPQSVMHECVKQQMGYDNPRRPAVNENLWPLPNVWLGCSVEDQQRADERIPHLLRTPAAVRFLSCEPLLGPADLTRVAYTDGGGTHLDVVNGHHGVLSAWKANGQRVDWVIVGGESGAGARPMRIEWARDLVNQCRDAGVPVFVKQFGAVPVMDEAAWRERSNSGAGTLLLSHANHARAPSGTVPLKLPDKKGGTPEQWPGGAAAWPREFPEVRNG